MLSALAVSQPHGAVQLRPEFPGGKHMDHSRLLTHIPQVVQRFLQGVFRITVRDQETQAFFQSFSMFHRFCQRIRFPVRHTAVQQAGQPRKSSPAGQLRKARCPAVLQAVQAQPVAACQGKVAHCLRRRAGGSPFCLHGSAGIQQDRNLGFLFLHKQLQEQLVKPRVGIPVQPADIIPRDVLPVIRKLCRGTSLPRPAAAARPALRPSAHSQGQRIQSAEKSIC